MKTTIPRFIPSSFLLALCFAAALAASAQAASLLVNVASTNPAPPYATWETAATNIQDAINAATTGDTVVVEQGTYQLGTVTAYTPLDTSTPVRVSIDKPIRVSSHRGPDVTTIQGRSSPNTPELAIRGVFMAAGSSLDGFTIQGCGTAYGQSGGALLAADSSPLVSNCVFRYSIAQNDGGAVKNATVLDSRLHDNIANSSGGAASDATLIRCRLENNTATNNGGAVVRSELWNCILTGNAAAGTGGAAWNSDLYNSFLTSNRSATNGGAVYGGNLVNCTIYANNCAGTARGAGIAQVNTVKNCIIAQNTRDNGVLDNYLTDSDTQRIDYSCTYPKPPAVGINNSSEDPRLARDESEARTNQPAFYILPLSPCINSGVNENWMTNATDLAGNPRIHGAAVDMGAYEWQGLSSGLPGYAPTNQSTIRLSGNLDYRFVTTNMTARRTLTIHNDGPGPLEIIRVRCLQTNFLANPNLWCDWDGDPLPPASSTNLLVRFRPTSPVDYDGLIIVDTYATARQTGDDSIPYLAAGTTLRIPTNWLAQYALPNGEIPDDSREDFNDYDGDTFTVWEEWRAMTIPTNSSSFLQFSSIRHISNGVEIAWVSSESRYYTLMRSTNLAAYTPFKPLVTHLRGSEGATLYFHTNTPVNVPTAYRINVEDADPE